MTETEQANIFKSWLEAHKGIFFKIIRSYAFTLPDEEDLFQEISVQVWRSIPSYKNACAPSTWIYRVALNTAIKWSSRQNKVGKESVSIENHSHMITPAKESSDQNLAWLYSEISKLDEVNRSITLLMLDGYSYKEMAAILGMTESNIGVRINRIKKDLTEKSKKVDHYEI